MMQRRVLALGASALGALLLAGCVTTELSYKVGVTPQERNRDVAACERAATRQAPVANQSRRTERRWIPARRHCNSKGCFYQGGYWVGGNIVTTDLNLTARTRAYGQCMQAKGYQTIGTTGCTGKIREAVLRAPQGRYPPLTANSCTVGMNDGTLKVYTP